MNNSESAKRGFRTFILTLSISLLVFSAVYYALTSYNPGNGSNTDQTEATDGLSANNVVGSNKAVDGSSSAGENPPSVKGTVDKRTVFGEIVNKKPQVQVQEVLAGATSAPSVPESTTSVPATGFTEMTVGLLLSFGLFVGAMVYNFLNPRKIALSRFEKKLIHRSK